MGVSQKLWMVYLCLFHGKSSENNLGVPQIIEKETVFHEINHSG